MRILVTGAKGFVGKNLCWALKNIQAGKDKTHPALSIEAVYEYDLDSTPEQLEHWCKDCDFVFNLAVSCHALVKPTGIFDRPLRQQ